MLLAIEGRGGGGGGGGYFHSIYTTMEIAPCWVFSNAVEGGYFHSNITKTQIHGAGMKYCLQ